MDSIILILDYAAEILKEVLELSRTIWYNNSLLSKIFLKMDFFRL